MLGTKRWQGVLALGTLRSYRPGAMLLRQGDQGGFLFAITSGRVKVLAGTAEGAEVLLSLRAAGDLVGELSAESGTRTATVLAIDRCTVVHLPGRVFHEFLGQHEVHGLFSDYLISKLSGTVPYQVQQAHFNPLQKLSRLILEVLSLAEHSRVDRMRIPFSQEALATALGLARSTVAEQIAELRSAGALAPGPRLVVADQHRLAEYARIVSEL